MNYTEKDLVAFGNYLLSEKRSKRIEGDKSVVHDPDLKNWQVAEELNFDPFCLPEWAKWIAMDENGIWYLYDVRPDIYDGCVWGVPSDGYLKIPKDYEPKNFKGHWKESLFNVKDLKEYALKKQSIINTLRD